LKDIPLRKKLMENARKTYEEQFSEEVAGGRIVREIESMGKDHV
jgi:hypothetical protein